MFTTSINFGRQEESIPQMASNETLRQNRLSQARTAWLTCHEALSHTNSRAVFPSAANHAVSHARNCVVLGPRVLQRPADRFITHTPRGHALFMAHLGS